MKLSDSDFLALRDFIYALCGIYFTTSKKYFVESRIARRMNALSIADPAEYLLLLKTANGRAKELNCLLDEITTNETYFFRNPQQLAALHKLMLPEVTATKSKIGFRKLRIWSAGSSSGEEAYTLAMNLMELQSTLLKDWTIEIIGTDISESVLALAREGVYGPYSVRNVPEPYMKKYFTTRVDGKYILSPAVKKLVSFSSLNLYDDMKMLFMKSFDFIFCANVLIYFDMAAKSKVVQHFHNNLQPYGYFFLGQSESLHDVNDKFTTIHFPGGFAYKK